MGVMKYLNQNLIDTSNKMPELTSYTHTNLSLSLCLMDTMDGSISLSDLDAFMGGSVSVGVFHTFITCHGVTGE